MYLPADTIIVIKYACVSTPVSLMVLEIVKKKQYNIVVFQLITVDLDALVLQLQENGSLV